MSGESTIEYTETISGYNQIGCAMPAKVPHCHCLGAGRGPTSLGCGLVGSTRWRTLRFPERKRESHLLNNCSILDIVTILVDHAVVRPLGAADHVRATTWGRQSRASSSLQRVLALSLPSGQSSKQCPALPLIVMGCDSQH